MCVLSAQRMYQMDRQTDRQKLHSQVTNKLGAHSGSPQIHVQALLSLIDPPGVYKCSRVDIGSGRGEGT